MAAAKRKKWCTVCGLLGLRNPEHNAYFCVWCDAWIEACCQSGCAACATRPVKPSNT